MTLAKPIYNGIRREIDLFFHLRHFITQSLIPSGLFPSGFPTKPLYVSFFSHACYMPFQSHPPWLGCSNYIFLRVQVMKLLIMHFPPIFCYLIRIFYSAIYSQTSSVPANCVTVILRSVIAHWLYADVSSWSGSLLNICSARRLCSCMFRPSYLNAKFTFIEDLLLLNNS
jgi:hypothetical protein